MEKIDVSLFLWVAIGCFLTAKVSSMHHIVGGNLGWDVPPNVTFYQEWAKPRTFGVGDKLVFPYRTGMQNIIQVNKKDFDACGQKEVVDMFYSGPTILDLPKTGEYYYYCGVGTHCEAGQKLAITVVDSEGSTGTPFPYDDGITNSTVLGVSNDSTNVTVDPKSSAGSVRNFGVVSGLVSLFSAYYLREGWMGI